MKRIIFVLVVILLYLICVDFYANERFIYTAEKIYIKLSLQLKNELNNEKRFAQDTGIINAISIAENKNIRKSLFDNNRTLAIQTLQKIEKTFASKTSIKHLKVHIHTKDTKAFVRSWKLNKFGDDLSGFRKAIIKVRITYEPFFGFEVGRMGLTLRSIVPIIKDKRFIGSLEFIQNFDTIMKTFKRKNYNYLLLLDQSRLNIAKYLIKAPRVGPFVLSSHIYNQQFLQESQKVNFKKLQKDGYFQSDHYFYTYEDIKDTENSIAGIHLLAMPINKLTQEIDKSHTKIIKSIVINSFFLLLILSALALVSIVLASNRNSK